MIWLFGTVAANFKIIGISSALILVFENAGHFLYDSISTIKVVNGNFSLLHNRFKIYDTKSLLGLITLIKY